MGAAWARHGMCESALIGTVHSDTVVVELNLYTGTVISSFIGEIIKFYALAIYNVSCISRLSYPP
jgi:hypothetical protein